MTSTEIPFPPVPNRSVGRGTSHLIHPPQRWPGDRAILVALTLVLILGAVLRLHALTQKSLWEDEIFGLNALGIYHVGQAIPQWSIMPENIIRYYRADNHPPLFFLLLAAWVKMFGADVFSVRMLSVAVNLLTIPVIYRLARRIFEARRVALIACLLSGCSAFLVYFSQEARMYPLVLLLSCLSSLFLLRILDGGGRGSYAGFAVLSALGLYTHYYYVFLICSQVIYWMLWRERRVLPFLFSLSAIALAFIPWLPAFLYQISQKNQSDLWIRSSGQGLARLETIAVQWIDVLFRFMAGENFVYPNTGRGLRIVCSVVGVAALAALLQWPLLRRRRGLFLLVWLAVPLAAGSLVDLFFQTRTLEASKYFIVSYPAVLLLVSAAIGFFPSRAVSAVMLSGLLLLNVNALAAYYRSSGLVEWRDVARYLSERVAADDILISPEPRVFTCVAFYLNRPVRAVQFPYGAPLDHMLGRIRAQGASSTRLWLVSAYESVAPWLQELSQQLEQEFRLVSSEAFARHATVRCFGNLPLEEARSQTGRLAAVGSGP